MLLESPETLASPIYVGAIGAPFGTFGVLGGLLSHPMAVLLGSTKGVSASGFGVQVRLRLWGCAFDQTSEVAASDWDLLVITSCRLTGAHPQ